MWPTPEWLYLNSQSAGTLLRQSKQLASRALCSIDILFIDEDLHDNEGSQDFRTKHCIQADRWEGVEQRNARDRVHSLVDVLPDSVETLTLVKPFIFLKEAMIMFAGLLECKARCFPLLREIILEDEMVFEQDMVDAYMEAGTNEIGNAFRNVKHAASGPATDIML